MFPNMATAPSSQITLEEIKTFYEMDRNLFSLLTIDLWRDPIESMWVMALWVWLEKSGFNNLIKKISSLLHFLINEVADEAMSCINYLTNTNPFAPSREPFNLPLTYSLLGADVSPNFFSRNRGAGILGVGKALSETCLRALSDLLQQAIERNTALVVAETRAVMSSFIESGFSRLDINNFDSRARTRLSPRVNNPPGAVHPDDRMMFVTFSKGYPVPELDILEFFNLVYGDCIESLHMQEVHFGKQSLYARIVFYTPHAIETVLNGAEKAKFTIKGRYMWVRKFVPKCRRPISPRAGMSRAGSF